MARNEVRVFIRFKGLSQEVDGQRYRIDSAADDHEVRRAVAQFLDVNVRELDTAVVERTRNGFVVRPNAIFG